MTEKWGEIQGKWHLVQASGGGGGLAFPRFATDDSCCFGGCNIFSVKNAYFSIYKSKCINKTETKQKQKSATHGTNQVR